MYTTSLSPVQLRLLHDAVLELAEACAGAAWLDDDRDLAAAATLIEQAAQHLSAGAMLRLLARRQAS